MPEAIELTLKQKATCIPPENVKDEVRCIVRYRRSYGDEIFIALPDGWIRLDLEDNTYAIGEYEG